MQADYRDYLVTIRVDEHRTYDRKVTSHSAHGAIAQYLQKHPKAKIICVRNAERKPTDPQD